MQDSTAMRLQRSTPRRIAAVALGWVASIPLLMSFGLYATIALQAAQQTGTAPGFSAGVVLLGLHLAGVAAQSLLFVRGAGVGKPTWWACLGVSLLLAAMASADAWASSPQFELLGPFSWPHIGFAAALFIWNKPRLFDVASERPRPVA